MLFDCWLISSEMLLPFLASLRQRAVFLLLYRMRSLLLPMTFLHNPLLLNDNSFAIFILLLATVVFSPDFQCISVSAKRVFRISLIVSTTISSSNSSLLLFFRQPSLSSSSSSAAVAAKYFHWENLLFLYSYYLNVLLKREIAYINIRI